VGNLSINETERNRRTIGTGLEKTFENGFVEFGVCATCEEPVEFYEEEEIDIFGGRGFTVTLTDVVALGKVDTLNNISSAMK
jgi:hypothetical protein